MIPLLLVGGVALATTRYALKKSREKSHSYCNENLKEEVFVEDEIITYKKYDTSEGIKSLSIRENDSLIYFVNKLNKQIAQAKSKKLTKFLITGLESLENFQVKYETKANRLDNLKNEQAKIDAEDGLMALTKATIKDLKYILIAGVKDVSSIVKEDFFGYKEYESIDDVLESMDRLTSRYDRHFSFHEECSILYELEEKIKKADRHSEYYNVMHNLKNEIEHANKILHHGSEIYSSLFSLYIKLTSLHLKIEFSKLNYEPMEDVEDSEKLIAEKYKNILQEASRYDKLVSGLERVNINNLKVY